jgi:hypothetical protein
MFEFCGAVYRNQWRECVAIMDKFIKVCFLFCALFDQLMYLALLQLTDNCGDT